MGLFNGVKKATKFAFVKLPSSLVGWEVNKRLFRNSKNNFLRAFNPTCPDCQKGILVVDPDSKIELPEGELSDNTLHPWHCTVCDYEVHAPKDSKKIRSAISDRIKEISLKDLGDMEREKILSLIKGHILSSYIFFFFSALLAGVFCYMMVTGRPLLLAANWFSFCIMFWIFGMRSSYRSWQLIHKRLFEKGAFWYWFKEENWFPRRLKKNV